MPRIERLWSDQRHTSETLMPAAAIAAKIVQERLGHKKIGTTLDVYAHVLPSMARDAADQLRATLHDAILGIGWQCVRNCHATNEKRPSKTGPFKGGAERGIRTPTVLLPPAPQAGASASSAISACGQFVWA